MSKVGRFVTDPRAGAYCQITLDSGERIVVNHNRGGFQGGNVAVEISKFMGLSSERLAVCDLDSSEGRAALGRLTRGVVPGSVEATPLAAFVGYLKDSTSRADLEARWATLMSGAGP